MPGPAARSLTPEWRLVTAVAILAQCRGGVPGRGKVGCGTRDRFRLEAKHEDRVARDRVGRRGWPW